MKKVIILCEDYHKVVSLTDEQYRLLEFLSTEDLLWDEVIWYDITNENTKV